MILLQSNINSIIPEIVAITNDIKSSFSGFIGVARVIVGLGSLFWIALKAWKIIATGEADGMAQHLQGFVKPFFLSLLLIFYSPLLSLCDFLIEPIGKSTEGWAMAYMDKNSAMEQKYKKDLETIITGNANTTAGTTKATDPIGEPDSDFSLDGMAKSVSSFFTSIISYIKLMFSISYWIGMLVGILNTLINFCLQISYLGVLVMRAINLSILIAFGPVAIGLSIFTPFADNWKSFFANYINKLLWFPIANMVLAIAYRLKNISDQNSYDVLLKFAKNTNMLFNMSLGADSNINNLFMTVNTIDWIPVFLSIGVTIIGIFAVSQTGSFANLIISGASGGMTSSPMSGGGLISSGAMVLAGAGMMANKGLSALTGGLGSKNSASVAEKAINGVNGGNGSEPGGNSAKKFGFPQDNSNGKPKSNIEV